ncbi:MAG: Holliday junction branch migration protein RuvA [Parvibaculales bacterium]
MIGRLKGLLEDKGDGWVLVDVNGVGYMVEVSSRLLGTLPTVGEPVVLAIETYVREDQLRLFGFGDENEKGLFKLLMGVQGVGAKVALAIQGVLSGEELVQAIAAQDKAMVARAPGVGPKVAQRIVQELKDKIPETSFATAAAFADADVGGESAGIADALSALENLGYARSQAHKAVMDGVQKAGETEVKTEDLIRLALKELGR